MKRIVRALLLLAGYPIAFQIAYASASLFWYPPAGLRFAVFLLVPPVWWLPVTLAAEAFGWWLDPQGWTRDFRGWTWFFALFLAAAVGPWLLRRRGAARIDGPASVGWLLAMMLLSALGASLVNLAWPFPDASDMVEATAAPGASLFLQLLLGDYLGMLILVPLAVMCVRQRPEGSHWRSDSTIILLLTLAIATWSLAGGANYQTYLFVTGLCLIPITYLAFRGGWRGAAIGVSTTSVLIAFSGWTHGQPQASVESQLLIATAGSTVLVLGAAIEALRSNREELQRRNAALAATNAQLDEMTAELRETAHRNLTLSEDLRRWITAELHDELGQGLTALQVRIKLAEQATSLPKALAPLRDIVAGMRRSVSGLLENLRPAGLDELGLESALRKGPLREMVESAGLRYQVRIGGDPKLLARLDNDSQTTLYRITQEAATNTLRHARASGFTAILRVRPDGGRLHVMLACIDDGVGMAQPPESGGIGLRGIGDRVLSSGGRMRIQSGPTGTRLVVTLSLRVAGPGD